jgi:hypothetical protein
MSEAIYGILFVHGEVSPSRTITEDNFSIDGFPCLFLQYLSLKISALKGPRQYDGGRVAPRA